jgi:predicted AAA+ superfamily ATPase
VIDRTKELDRGGDLLRLNPIAALLGARQVGKTTLARQLAARQSQPPPFFDLENPADLARLADPMLALEPLTGLVVIDEIQRRPDLFPVLRVLADREGTPARFLLLGSASPELLRQSSESLAGRIAYHELGGFSLDEVGSSSLKSLWSRGGFPRSFLAESDSASVEWRRDFVRTFLERDLPQLGIRIPAQTLGRFWTMLAHYHGQMWHGAELARAIAIAESTVRRYLDTLVAALVVRVLPAWHENLGKRQVKSPKVFVADSGLLHALLGLEDADDLAAHPKVGASWEGFAGAEIERRLGTRRGECSFWATHGGAELDLLVVRGRRRRGFEFKYSSAPVLTPSMRIAVDDLRLDSLEVIHAGSETYRLGDRVRAVPLARVAAEVEPLELGGPDRQRGGPRGGPYSG